MNEYLDQPVRALAGIHFQCGCGRLHASSIDKILLGAGILPEAAEALAAMGKKAALFADRHTWACAGERLCALLKDKIEVIPYVFSDAALVPDEYALGRALMAAPEDADLLIAVGSGTLNDLTRYLSLRTGIPYAVVGTAPSMDGYASVVSPLICGGMKITFPGVYPKLIAADTDILKNAPERMLAAGFGDVIGKVTALLDWRLAHILNDEYRCDAIMSLVQKAVDRCVSSASALPQRDKKGVEAVMEALLLTGICIGFAGFSRPASGSEHHIAHFMEITELAAGKPVEWLHGNHVGMATGVILLAYRYLSMQDMEAIMKAGTHRRFDTSEWEQRLHTGFGPLAPGIIENRRPYEEADPEKRDRAMARIVSRWDRVRAEVLGDIMDFDTYRQAMEAAGAAWHPRDMGLGREAFVEAFLLAKEVRTRYGILQTLEDTGILREAAEWVAARYYR